MNCYRAASRVSSWEALPSGSRPLRGPKVSQGLPSWKNFGDLLSTSWAPGTSWASTVVSCETSTWFPLVSHVEDCVMCVLRPWKIDAFLASSFGKNLHGERNNKDGFRKKSLSFRKLEDLSCSGESSICRCFGMSRLWIFSQRTSESSSGSSNVSDMSSVLHQCTGRLLVDFRRHHNWIETLTAALSSCFKGRAAPLQPSCRRGGADLDRAWASKHFHQAKL